MSLGNRKNERIQSVAPVCGFTISPSLIAGAWIVGHLCCIRVRIRQHHLVQYLASSRQKRFSPKRLDDSVLDLSIYQLLCTGMS